jgi:hypothetical protein
MASKIKPVINEAAKKKQSKKQATQVNPLGVRHKVIKANGKVGWEWGCEGRCIREMGSAG